MAPVYGLLGISVRVIRRGMDADQRRAAYAADVTYVTATEARFDYLRDAERRPWRQPVDEELHGLGLYR